jgi:ribosomal protein L12E/L44/L45/RPP1/RPP2
LTQLHIKLLQTTDHYHNEPARLRYAVSRLEDVALEQILPKVTETNVQLASLTELIQLLNNAFGDPDKEATADRELTKLY